MKRILLLPVFMLVALVSFGQEKTWVSDPAHSRLGFIVKHLTIAEIDGRFSDFTVQVSTTKPDYSDAKIRLVAQVLSIDTGVEARDKHLVTADFFDAVKYPTLVFESSVFEKVGENKAKLVGNLTMHGVTKLVTLDVIYNGSVVNPMNNKETVGFKITGLLKRSEFAIGPNFPEFVISEDIQIDADIEFSPSN